MITHIINQLNGIPRRIQFLGAAGMLLLAACKPPAGGADSHAGHGHGGEAGAGAHVKDGICQEHNVPEGDCGICNPDKIAGLEPGQSLQLRLASNKSADVAGVMTAKADEGLMRDGIECYAEFGFDLPDVRFPDQQRIGMGE